MPSNPIQHPSALQAAVDNTSTFSSPYLANLINAFGAQPGRQIDVDANTGGDFAGKANASNVVTFNPNSIPVDVISGSATAAQFPLLVAHELGHALLPGGHGYVNCTGRNGNPANAAEAIASGRINEGVAVAAEYIVAMARATTFCGSPATPPTSRASARE
jgi:hypothetical protein